MVSVLMRVDRGSYGGVMRDAKNKRRNLKRKSKTFNPNNCQVCSIHKYPLKINETFKCFPALFT